MYRIVALKDFQPGNGEDSNASLVKTGTLGGWVSNYGNLSQSGSCWISDEAVACHKAKVTENARLKDFAWVRHEAKIHGCSLISHYANINDRADISDSFISDHVTIHDDVHIEKHCYLYNNVCIRDKAFLSDQVEIKGSVRVTDRAKIWDRATIHGMTLVSGRSNIYSRVWLDSMTVIDYAKIHGPLHLISGTVCGHAEVFASDRVELCGNFNIRHYAKVHVVRNMATNGIIRSTMGNHKTSPQPMILQSGDWFQISPMGSRDATLLFYRMSDQSIVASTGCFCDTIENFLKRVKTTHGSLKQEQTNHYWDYVSAVWTAANRMNFKDQLVKDKNSRRIFKHYIDAENGEGFKRGKTRTKP